MLLSVGLYFVLVTKYISFKTQSSFLDTLYFRLVKLSGQHVTWNGKSCKIFVKTL
jgi:hypothetical protein